MQADIFTSSNSALHSIAPVLKEKNIYVKILTNDDSPDAISHDFAIYEVDNNKDEEDVNKVLKEYKDVFFVLDNEQIKQYKPIIKELNGGFIVKPFCDDELFLRLERHLPTLKDEAKLKYKNITVYFEKHEVYVSDKLVNLSSLEYNILLYLIRHKNSIVTKEQLIADVWHDDPRYFKLDKVRVAIFRLKSKLDIDGAKEYIHAKSGFGYLLD